MAGYTKQYRQNRARVLEGSPRCAICQRRKATTVDHIQPLAMGGSDDMSNLRPACVKCNSSLGAQLGNAMRAETKRRRAEAVDTSRPGSESPEPFFCAPTAPRAPRDALSLERQLEPASGDLEPGSAVFGRTEPRLHTTRAGWATYGPEAGRVAAELLGRPLWPWQQLALDGLLAHSPDPRDGFPNLASPVGLTTCARQQGKTRILETLIVWALTEWPKHRGEPVQVLSAAHTLKIAESVFRPLIPILKDRLGASVYTSSGRLEAHLPNGSEWHVVASNVSAGHGFRPALVVLDEIWKISDEIITNGFQPAMRAQRSPLLAMFSTAGDSSSTAFQRFRQQGIRAAQEHSIDMFLAEWSPPDDALLESDPSSWLWANPSIGWNPALTLESLAQTARSVTRAEFLRSYLNVWIGSAAGWLDAGVWGSAALPADTELPPATWWAIDSTPDEARYSAVAAHPLGDGTIALTVPVSVSTEAELWRAIAEQLPPAAWLAVTPTLELHTPLNLRRRVRRVGYGEIAAWTAETRSAIVEGRVRHTGDPALADHMSRAVATKTERGIALSTKASAGPIELARCAVWAAWLALTPAQTGRPIIVTSSRT